MKLRLWSIRTLSIVGWSVSACALASASSSHGVTPITSDALTGTWELKCQASPENHGDEDDVFASGTMTFSDGDVVVDLVIYLDAACTVKEESVKQTSTYVIGDSHGDGQKIDITDHGSLVFGTFKTDGRKLSLSDFEATEAKRPTTYTMHLDKVNP